MSERTCQHDSRPHTPEDIERAGGPGFLTPGFLLAAPSHPSRTVASVPRSLPVTVAGAAPELHRLPSTTSAFGAASTNRVRSSIRIHHRGSQRLCVPLCPSVVKPVRCALGCFDHCALAAV